MKKLSLITEFKSYQNSDLQKIVRNNPLPSKWTINGTDCYFYNADLFGLFELKVVKNGLTPDDFAEDYQRGFEAGMQHLNEQEQINLKDLKSKDLREGTILQIKNLLHEREFKPNIKGLLNLVFNNIPLIFTEKSIYDFGYWNGIIFSIDDLCKKIGLTPDKLQTFVIEKNGNENESPKPKPTIQPEAFEAVFSILKDFFDEEYQNEFETVFKTFGTVKNKLTFKSNGNKFADIFKKLFDNHFITGCQKTDLINWIVSNFNYLYRNEVREFKNKELQKTISGNQTPCKNPIIEINNNKILKVTY